MGSVGREKRILVVEDNAKNLKLVTDLLKYRGHAVLTAMDGESGVETALREIPDLILMDIQMPGMDGLTATRKIKNDRRTADIPVLAVTAHAMRGDSSKIRESGCDGYVTKPIQTREFIKIVEKVLNVDSETASEPEGETESRETDTADSFTTSKATILVVDDEERNRRVAEATLAPIGYSIRHASNGEEALREIDKEPPDLILLDVMMPGLDGLEVTRRIRGKKETRHIPIILLTAFTDSDRRLKGIEAGCDDFVAKPFDRTELSTRIHSLLRVSYYRSQLADYKRSDAILAEIGDGVVLMDSEWHIEQLNEAAARFLEQPREKCFGLDLMNYICENRHIPAGKKTLHNPDTENLRFEIHRTETELSPLLVLDGTAKRIHEPSGAVSSIVLTLRDITQRWTENRLKEDFLSSVSHKLKTPLSVISANTEALLFGYYDECTDKQKEVLTSIDRATHDLLNHVNKLLAFTSPESYGGTHRETIRVADFLEEYSSDAYARYKERRVALTVSVDPDAEDFLIAGQSVSMILDNLVENSVKFSTDDSPEIRIMVRLVDNDKVEFGVRDNGSGIPAEDIEHLFDEFYQVEKYFTGMVTGSGLGLSIVRKIVEEMGGSVRVNSRLGYGSTFFFTVPARSASDGTE